MSDARFHAMTWLVWAIAGAVCVQLAPSPVYVALVIAAAWVVVSAHSSHGPLARAFPLLLALGVVMGLIKIVLTALTTHGIGDALFTIPSFTLPAILGGFTVGGAIEGQVVAQAAAEAFAIVGVLAVFGAFNAVVAHDELVRSFPRAFHEPGLVLTIGLAFVPATVDSVRDIEESDRSRAGGTAVRRGRLLRLAVPLLESGLERAISLAESMESRGFARDQATPAERHAAWLALGGFVGLLGVLVALVAQARSLALAFLLGSVVAIGAAVALSSRDSERTRYRPRPLRRADAAVMLTSVGAIVGLALVAVFGAEGLRWQGSGAPPVPNLLAAGAIALLAAPAAWPAIEPRESGQPVLRHDEDAPKEVAP